MWSSAVPVSSSLPRFGEGTKSCPPLHLIVSIGSPMSNLFMKETGSSSVACHFLPTGLHLTAACPPPLSPLAATSRPHLASSSVSDAQSLAGEDAQSGSAPSSPPAEAQPEAQPEAQGGHAPPALPAAASCLALSAALSALLTSILVFCRSPRQSRCWVSAPLSWCSRSPTVPSRSFTRPINSTTRVCKPGAAVDDSTGSWRPPKRTAENSTPETK
mmetsp:Transcript_9532/g.21656  ORF Transcript_9532/g.21656 Transcript_9532/m.21656 type:complete len:216 (-) Transcript_9532:236-883(-)